MPLYLKDKLVSGTGAPGKSAYEAAKAGGYIGTEAEFNQALKDIPGHIANEDNPHGVTAAQVGARPNTWMPSASDVGAYTKTETDTLLQNNDPRQWGIGKSFNVLPSPYDANTITLGGIYAVKKNSPTGDWATVLHIPYGDNRATQICMMASDDYKECWLKREKYAGTWEPWGWVNPPFIRDIVYRTTERYIGNPVYKKMDSNGVIWWSTDQSTWKREAERVGAASIQENSVRFYVSPSGSDTSGDGSESNPFKTIQHAANLLPNFLKFNGGATARIELLDGTYTETVTIEHIKGWYMSSVTIEAVNAKNATIDGNVNFRECANIGIYNVKITQSVNIEGCINIAVDSCDFINGDPNTTGGILVSGSIASLYRSSISNRHDAVMALQGAIVSCFALSGSGNVNAYNVGNINGSAAIIMHNASTIEATTQEVRMYGGQIFT